MKTVFIVDDSPTILMSLTEILQKAGFQVQKSPNANQALSTLQSGQKPDLIITDLNMPGMNGIDFIKEVRKLAGFRFLPILVLTTESQQAKRQEAKAVGATGWLVKPVSGTDLINVIKQVVPGA
jgi:two-component system chemotaxis response regulator CheY